MTIVQIGACKGYDHVYNFVKDLTDNFLIIVEPMAFHQDDLERCYSPVKQKNNVIQVPACIVPYEQTSKVTIYYSVNDAPEYQVASINKQHVLKHGYSESSIGQFSVTALTLDQLFAQYSIRALDYLFLDIEGIDAEVILAFDLNKYNIKNIQIEHLHLGNKTELVKQKFFDAGYHITGAIGGVGFDTLFTKNNNGKEN